MKKKMYLSLFLLSLLFTQNASAFCDGFSTKVYVTINPGNVKYVTTRSRHDFVHSSPTPVSPNTLGLTVSHLSIRGEATPQVETKNGKMCVSLKILEIIMENDELTVYIDKKYKPSSCEYQVIKNHEKYHVAVAQQAMIFFKPDIEEQVQKSLQNLSPQIVGNPREKDEVVRSQLEKILNDLRPLISHINKVIAKKNYQIDTPESYEKTRALCKNW